MDPTGLNILLGLICVIALIISWFWWQFRRVRTARNWPSTEAVIQSGDMEAVTSSRGMPVNLPVFAFSYRVGGEYYSGRFSLMFSAEPNEALLVRMIDQKFQVHYHPNRPATYFVPEDLVYGCKVGQKLGPHIAHLYPKD